MAIQRSDRGSETDYLGKLYAGPLDGPVMRGYMQISLEACLHFGTLACIDCPLVEFVPQVVPGCELKDCPNCPTRRGCPCGNEELRRTLLEEMGVEITLIDE